MNFLPPQKSRVLVAMSGGVDSAVTASLLVKAGYDCHGVTMRLVPEHEGKSVFEPCCGTKAGEDAKRVCDKLGIPHQTQHAVDRFDRDIIQYFIAEYQEGRTPNPCARCNRMIKFGALYQKADELGCDYIAMGHYTRLERLGPRISLRRGVYAPKDQSYVLAPLTQAQLRRACFPLGEMTKEQVREHAWGLDFGMAVKGESQEICFVPDRDYAGFIERRTEAPKPGKIINTGGEVLGEHKGLIHYTLGQRRGLGVAAERPLYVLKVDMENNALVVGYQEETLETSFTCNPLMWGGMAPTAEPFEALVQLRSRHAPVPATVTPLRTQTQIRLHAPESAITPGQWAVLYDTDGFVLASSVIREVEHS